MNLIKGKKSNVTDPDSKGLQDAKDKLLKHLDEYVASNPWTEEEIHESNIFESVVTQLDDIYIGKITDKQKKNLSLLAIHESDLSDDKKRELYDQLDTIYSKLER